SKRAFNVDKPWKSHTASERMQLSETDRKRMEGLWEANRDRYVLNDWRMSPLFGVDAVAIGVNVNDKERLVDPFGNMEVDVVHGLVIREIWRRSLLDDELLMQIWDLVDRNFKGYLCREEFVLGTWIVDQCLYGRKLPAKLGKNIWMS
ncbi:hypothetical protein CANCADRAFT_15995, partial [Tortispora caseinolytica NRRL Y-17796]